ncbi:MAG TPA: HEAT repeat domain-containing protein [Labilithrix sp.]
MGWTPGIRDLPGLLDLFAGEDEADARAAEKAVLRIEARQHARVLDEAIARTRAATRPARGRLTRLVDRLASANAESADAARAFFLEMLGDADPKTRRAAARALGKLPSPEPETERALLAAWDVADSDDDRNALADALGRIGTPAARERIASLGARGSRAAVMLDRETSRERPGAIDASRAFDGPIVVRFHTRAGLERVVVDELGDIWRPRIAGPGVVEARLDGPLALALAVRTATHVAFPLDPVPIEGGLAETIVRAVTSPAAMRVFSTYTQRDDGAPIRFRLAWARGGHRRSLAWRCAELVRETTTELVNDPTASTWEVVVDDGDDTVAIDLVPRAEDTRFAYRKRTVSASSHPTIAAALARLAPRRAGDVVWDPFCGAGAELFERARLGPYARLIGTDTAGDAIAAARENTAGLENIVLEIADATRHRPRDVNVIVTNPPMGRRLHRGAHGEILERFVSHAADVLVPGGFLVWTVPEPRRVHARAARAGLVLERAWTVDMGGFPAALSVHRKK